MTITEFTSPPSDPIIIQGGMGAGVSNWMLARAVSLRGQLGVVSGTVIDTIFVRRLQDGDHGGHLRRAMAQFPCPPVAEAALTRYFHPEGRAPGTPYKALPTYKQVVSAARQQLTVLASFVEVWLAKEGHQNPVGINVLTKVQLPNLATLYGAMLAGVDVVLMGAGIPREIPGALDAMALHQPAVIRMDVEGGGDAEYLTFDPGEHGAMRVTLKRPKFYPIVSANSLATTLARKANGRVDGFVIEGPTAGGHNAPPRGEMRLSASGEPLYGERDAVDLAKIRELGLPFWLAGGTGSPEGLRAALDAGAAGIQVGTLFAFADESGVVPGLKEEVLAGVNRGDVRVRTDPRASPTGYPFKLVELDGGTYQTPDRERVCDLGYLRVAYRTDTGGIGYRCPAEPVDAYVAKGGTADETHGRRCLCNALLANIGHAQVRPRWDDELPLLTSGDDLVGMAPFLRGRTRYSAGDVLDYLLAGVTVDAASRATAGA
ncbi:MAG: nitronate monooxygenase [Gemmatimonadaceae bacterium]|nr:nitronate monooxygenase [Gemmatimonadaceae bacterium]